MERLTERDMNCPDPKEVYGVYVKDHDYVAAAHRLADYEDTELTPAEVRSMYGEWKAMMSVLNSIGSYDRLRELAEADKDGRLVVLPCKVGDTLWVTGRDNVPREMELVVYVHPKGRYIVAECGGVRETFFPEEVLT